MIKSLKDFWTLILTAVLSSIGFLLVDALIFCLCWVFNYFLGAIIIWAIIFGGFIFLPLLWFLLEGIIIYMVDWIIKRGWSIDVSGVVIIVFSFLNLLSRLSEFWSTNNSPISGHLFMRISQTILTLFATIWAVKTALQFIKTQKNQQ